MARPESTIHASAVLIGSKAVLIRGPAGSGKSQLAWDLVTAAAQNLLPFARMVADDRAFLENHEPVAVVGLVVDLGAGDAARLPEKPATTAVIEGVSVPRLAVAAGTAALPLVLAAMHTPSAGD